MRSMRRLAEQDYFALKGKHFSFSNLRLLPRTLQRPSPPRWTTVVSVDSARRAARRGLKISTGFNSTARIKSIFDAYRDEAKAAGFAAGPDRLALRRRVTVAATPDEARSYASAVADRLKSYVAQDFRVQSERTGQSNAGRRIYRQR